MGRTCFITTQHLQNCFIFSHPFMHGNHISFSTETIVSLCVYVLLLFYFFHQNLCFIHVFECESRSKYSPSSILIHIHVYHSTPLFFHFFGKAFFALFLIRSARIGLIIRKANLTQVTSKCKLNSNHIKRRPNNKGTTKKY